MGPGDDMAVHTTELGAPMDYREHQRTFNGFVIITKLVMLGTIDVLLALVLYAFGGSFGFWLGTLMILLMMAAFALGLAMRGTLKPLIGVTVLGVLLVILTAG